MNLLVKIVFSLGVVDMNIQYDFYLYGKFAQWNLFNFVLMLGDGNGDVFTCKNWLCNHYSFNLR